MAILNLKIFGVGISTDASEPDIILSTEEKLDEQGESQLVKKEVQLTNNSGTGIYNLSLVNLQFHKKMYQPTEIYAEISVVKKDEQAAWVPVTRDAIDTTFKNKKVSLVDIEGLTATEAIPTHKKVGEDFYVHAVHVKYKSNYMRIILSIFSLDKQMTLVNTCRTFVGKKLKEGILKSEISNYKVPYDKDKKQTLTYNANMKNLSYVSSGKSTEHIFPFLVQYNESFYDMLARTTNRWGEFMYYEDGKLNVGYTQSTAIPVPTTINERNSQDKDPKLPLFNSLSYYDVDDQETGDDNYDCSASYDDNISSDPIRIDPEKITANFLTPWRDKYDKAVMKKFSSFFKNDKNLPTFLGNELFNDLYDLTKQGISVKSGNNDRENEFFTDEKKNKAPEQYAEYNFGDDKDKDNAMGFNPFSEINSPYKKEKYFDILTNEIKAGKNAICINFDTSYPCLKLGQIISVYGNEYIVTQIDCTTNVPLNPKNNLWTVSSEKAVYSFQVYALAKQGSQFYPTVIPAGHVRLADPQIATVTDASDPNGNGRVRVMFSWQTIVKDSDKNITDDTKEASSPWLQFTANAGGKKGIMGMHYENDKVFVGFVDGNVERPYVIGAISKGAGADIHCTTAGSHQLKIFDDEAGITAFMTGMFLPVWGTFSDFIPGMGDVNPSSGDKNNLALAGGFELSDNYGIYKITGSTDGREVSIASPWGEVNIGAFTGINITAPNGDVKIYGKNVSIEAGNNLSLVSGKNVDYKLWKEKDTKKGAASQFFLDMSAAVVKKLTESLVNIVDLSILRSVIEIVLRPVEGNLTIKSNRYMMLEAGKSKCEYPKEAYASEADQKKKLDEEAKKDILSTVKPVIGIGKGMVDLFRSIEGIVADIDNKFVSTYNHCVELKEKFKKVSEKLNDWKNSYGESDKNIYKNSFDDIIKSLWGKTNFEECTETALFSDEVKIEGNANAIVTQKCHDAHKFRMGITNPTVHLRSGYHTDLINQGIVDMRKELRKKALDALNKLAKEIFLLEHFEMTKASIGKSKKNLDWFAFRAVPEDFKEKMINAFSREKCSNSPYYNSRNLTDDEKKLNSKVQTIATGTYSSDNKKLMKRLVTMNLLEELGFKNEMRREIGNPNAVPPVPLAVPPIPQKDVTDASNNESIMNTTCWNNYIESLNGLPALGKDNTTIGEAFKDALEDARDNIMFWKGLGERSTWSDGKNGDILFAKDKKTYALDAAHLKEQTILKSDIESVKDSDFMDHSPESKRIIAFMNMIRDELKERP